MVLRAVEGIKVNDETLAFDLIKQVGPAGNFITAKHTRRHMRSEHYEPTVSDRNLREDWEAEGGKPTWERAKIKVKQILENNDYGLPEEVRNSVLSEIPDIVHLL
jgi:trimethylamine--corrinoid protein Co-methyltransferase